MKKLAIASALLSALAVVAQQTLTKLKLVVLTIILIQITAAA